MLGFPATAALASPTPISISIPSTSKPLSIHPLITNAKQPSSSLNFQQSPRNPRKFVVRAENRNGPSTDPKQETEKKGDEGLKDSTAGDGGEDGKRNGRPTFNLRWTDLVLDPDPDNVVAVGLTGLLAWASVQVLWQLFFISLAILVAALKYSFIAALLIFILITLL